MPRYYFDLRDGDELAVDEEGLALPDLPRVQAEAAKTLSDMARDAVHTSASDRGWYHMAIEVRDDVGPVIHAKFSFEVEKLKH